MIEKETGVVRTSSSFGDELNTLGRRKSFNTEKR